MEKNLTNLARECVSKILWPAMKSELCIPGLEYTLLLEHQRTFPIQIIFFLFSSYSVSTIAGKD